MLKNKFSNYKKKISTIISWSWKATYYVSKFRSNERSMNFTIKKKPRHRNTNTLQAKIRIYVQILIIDEV